MNKTMKVLIFTLVSCVALTSISCQSLRKKFTREKKEKKAEDFNPVLDPIDYDVYVQSSKERYKYHYSLWQVWQKDLTRAFTEKESEKSIVYLFNRIEGQLQEMSRWLNAQTVTGLQKLSRDYVNLREEFQAKGAVGRGYIFKTKVNRLGKEMRLNYSPTQLEGAYKTISE